MEEITVTYSSPIVVMESRGDKVWLKGTLIRLDVPTANGRIYRFEEANTIADEAIGKPVFVFARMGKHLRDKTHEVGNIVKTWVNEAKRSIEGIIEVGNTEFFPHIIEEVKEGWGFSVGGIVKAMQMISSGGNLLMKCVNFMIDHVQLLRPNTQADGGAIVESVSNVPVEETISFSRDPWAEVSFLKGEETIIYVKGSNIKRVTFNEEG